MWECDVEGLGAGRAAGQGSNRLYLGVCGFWRSGAQGTPEGGSACMGKLNSRRGLYIGLSVGRAAGWRGGCGIGFFNLFELQYCGRFSFSSAAPRFILVRLTILVSPKWRHLLLLLHVVKDVFAHGHHLNLGLREASPVPDFLVVQRCYY